MQLIGRHGCFFEAFKIKGSLSIPFITASEFDLEQLPSIFIIGGIIAVASSIFTVPFKSDSSFPNSKMVKSSNIGFEV